MTGNKDLEFVKGLTQLTQLKVALRSYEQADLNDQSRCDGVNEYGYNL